MNSYDPEQLRELYLACTATKGSKARGDALEDFVEHVFLQIPSVKLYERDVKDENGEQEVDLIFTHLSSVSQLPIHDVVAVVECKNERKKTGPEHINHFAMKLRTRGVPIGVLVTSAGLSGGRGRYGHAAITTALSTGVTIIVIEAAELAGLSAADELVGLLRLRLSELRTFRGYRSI